MQRTLAQIIVLIFLCCDHVTPSPYEDEPNASLRPFSSSFHQPAPPILKGAFRANWNQHKWDSNVSHITSGFLYNSPANNKVRVDQAFDGTLGSSLFDFANVTKDGTILNKYFELSPSIASKPTCTQYFVNSDFPLIPADFLVSAGAVFTGMVIDDFGDRVTSWDLMYQGAIPVTVRVDSSNTVTGYDYFSVNLRTRVITNFFNIIVGEVEAGTFDFPDCTS